MTEHRTAVGRRAFLQYAARGALGVSALAIAARLQAQAAADPAQGAQGATTTGPMEQEAYRPVKRDPKPGAKPQLDKAGIEALEHELACPCPCTLDVYTCRTTMLTCGISPQVHGDVMQLVEGGYSADEIMKAMLDTYGDFILMAPRKQGFNLLAWFAPFAALGVGALGIGALLRGWRRNSDVAQRAGAARADVVPLHADGVDATPEELARLEAAIRGDQPS